MLNRYYWMISFLIGFAFGQDSSFTFQQNDYVNIQSLNTIQPENAMTIECWVNPDQENYDNFDPIIQYLRITEVGQESGFSIIYYDGMFQYSLFNHFSVRARGINSGDNTSRIDERIRPIAKPWEKQIHVDFLHKIYLICFSWQDRIIDIMTGEGSEKLYFELTVSSMLGYGFQSIIILFLGLSMNINLLNDLILYVNGAIMIIVILKSRF